MNEVSKRRLLDKSSEIQGSTKQFILKSAAPVDSNDEPWGKIVITDMYDNEYSFTPALNDTGNGYREELISIDNYLGDKVKQIKFIIYDGINNGIVTLQFIDSIVSDKQFKISKASFNTIQNPRAWLNGNIGQYDSTEYVDKIIFQHTAYVSGFGDILLLELSNGDTTILFYIA